MAKVSKLKFQIALKKFNGGHFYKEMSQMVISLSEKIQIKFAVAKEIVEQNWVKNNNV